MKIWILAIASILVGLIAGAGSALWDTDVFDPLPFEVHMLNTVSPDVVPLPPAGGPQPKLVVDSPHYSFGRMERKATGHHTFVLKNIGAYPLVLRKGKTTCKCTLSDLEDSEVPPGGQTEVTLEWTAKTYDTLFRQEATIYSNDPARRRTLTLTIEGLVVDSVVVNPPEIVFSNLTPDEESTAKTRIFTSLSDDLQIVGHTFDNEETAKFYDIRSEAIPSGELPPEMKSGREVFITVKPGLPPGGIEQKISIKTNLQDIPDAEIRVGGRIGSPISVVGREWDQDRGTIRLGTIDGAQGTKRQLRIMIRGQHRQQIELRNPHAVPELLKVTLGEREELGNVVAVPLVVEVPSGSPAVNYLGYTPESTGEITIETSDPQMPELHLKVNFAVSEK